MAEEWELSSLPPVGREQVRKTLRRALQATLEGSGRTVLLRGEMGTGKSRLCRDLAEEATRRGFVVAQGRAFQAESGVPYALVSDAFLPLLRALSPETLTVLSRGGVPELDPIFPGLSSSVGTPEAVEADSPREQRTRTLWTLVEVLRGLGSRQPVFVILEDLQWADPSSLEATHFLSRHLADAYVLLLLTRDDMPGEAAEGVSAMERSLLAEDFAQEIHLPPFTREDTGRLLEELFGVGEKAAGEFADHLHERTGGNPFFLVATLQSLVRDGGLYRKGEAWLGWEIRDWEMASNVKDVVLDRLTRLPAAARNLADLAAALGGRVPFSRLRTLSELSEDELLRSLDLLVKQDLLLEGLGSGGAMEGEVVYDFQVPLVRETLLGEMSLARSRILHGRIARTLEGSLDPEAPETADILAYHFCQSSGEDTPSAIRHLTRAGRNALERFGNAEAARYLQTALFLLDRRASRGEPPVEMDGGRRRLLEDLARAWSRLADYDAAVPLWREATGLAEAEGAVDDVAEYRRRIGIIRSYQGDPAGAVEEFDGILAEASKTLSPDRLARIRLRRGVALEELGRLDEAREELEAVLTMADALDDPVILAQAHRALVLLHIWTGRPDRVRQHAAQAMAFARASGALSVEFWTHWGLAVLEGLLGNTQLMADHVQEANRVAERLRSPVLKLRSAELAIEEASATGQWTQGIAMGEQAINLARNLSQNTILPRLLVWTSLIYLSRGEVELARPLVEEAWQVAGAERHGAPNVHAEIPAYIGKGYLALMEGKIDEAVRIGRRALKIADDAGYGLWAIHRLVPLLAEAYLWKGDLEGAREMGKRLRSRSSPIQHKLGMAWGRSCDALVTWLEGDPGEGARMMEEAAQALEEVPMIGDAARLRRMKAGRLAEMGDRKGALDELTRVHETFLRLGAEIELEKTRGMFRELGTRPPRRAVPGEGELSPRESEIARLIGERKSNKAIARELGISPRTVSTHLSNVYHKLGISSRGELADYVRSEGFPQA